MKDAPRNAPKNAPKNPLKPSAWRLPKKIWALIILGAVGLHVAAYFVATQVRIKPPRHIPRPNFNGFEEITVDPGTGERTIHREFVVSTKLLPREEAAPADD